ncbi:right-handed parallel beta-helix repeat-containing protein [Dyadobacter tibetensis]|uniref:right-handed parallel beta-helix repeat-containing protein n=1 Tax=Dyadobacter tibetensis TaxID=1211851 RepID=UPI0018DBCE7A|nr:right-handed parallel beta-helix repeat-containing protein [Dyadobacter tibetensis]
MKNHIIFSGILLLLVSILSCKTNKEIGPSGSLKADAGIDRTSLVGDTVFLDGTKTKGPDDQPITFAWELLTQPNASKAVIVNSQTAKAYFIPDLMGVYEIKLKASTSKLTDSAVTKITANLAKEPIPLTQDIAQPMNLTDRNGESDQPDYLIDGNISLLAELTIQPGVVVAFTENSFMDVKSNGGLKALGTADAHITFRGVESKENFWGGIRLNTENNQLKYVDIFNAGAADPLSKNQAAIHLTTTGKASVEIENCSITGNSGYGLLVEQGNTLKKFSNNTLRGYRNAAIRIDATNAQRLDKASLYASNVIEIGPSEILDTESAEVVWPELNKGIVFRILSEVSVNAGWKIAPGTVIEMGSDVAIMVHKGYFLAEGTPENPITIRGQQNQAGYWRGILFQTNNSQNALVHTIIQDGGSSNLVAGTKASLAVFGRALMQVTHSRIENSAGWGIFAGVGTETNTDILESNQFKDNLLGDVKRQNIF